MGSSHLKDRGFCRTNLFPPSPRTPALLGCFQRVISQATLCSSDLSRFTENSCNLACVLRLLVSTLVPSDSRLLSAKQIVQLPNSTENLPEDFRVAVQRRGGRWWSPTPLLPAAEAQTRCSPRWFSARGAQRGVSSPALHTGLPRGDSVFVLNIRGSLESLR